MSWWPGRSRWLCVTWALDIPFHQNFFVIVAAPFLRLLETYTRPWTFQHVHKIPRKENYCILAIGIIVIHPCNVFPHTVICKKIICRKCMTLSNVILNHMILLTMEQQTNTTVCLKGNIVQRETSLKWTQLRQEWCWSERRSIARTWTKTWSLGTKHMVSCLAPHFGSQLPPVISATACWSVLSLATCVNLSQWCWWDQSWTGCPSVS